MTVVDDDAADFVTVPVDPGDGTADASTMVAEDYTGTGSVGGRNGIRLGTRYWLGILIVILALFGAQQWQAYQQLRDIEETDAAILSSDLPIDAYLDRGFQNWLKHVSDDDD